MATHKQRIEALEATAGGFDDTVVLILQGIDPRRPDNEVVTIKSSDGTVWKRKPKETEQAFKDRACKEVSKKAGITLLMATMQSWARPAGGV